jgi:hypothetical protein
MIDTVQIKRAQLMTGTFTIGSGREVILIMGSCRSVPYLNYLNEWNKSNRFTIHFLDPHNWNWNLNNEFVDYHREIEKQENNKGLLKVLSSVDIFIHEYYKNYGMFNTMDEGKNIYDFGIKPSIDICVPNFNDHFIFFQDIVSFDPVIKEKARKDYSEIGKLSEETATEICSLGEKSMDKFYSICELSDIPEMKDYFKENFKTTRFFWTSNHISKYFSLAIFRFLNDKFLRLELSESFWAEISKEDIYANNYTYLTEYDLKYYGMDWNEEIKPLTI